MPSEHKPHSRDEIIEEARALIAYIDHGTFGNCPTVDSTEIVRDYISLFEQLETLENACEQALMLLSRKRFDDDPEAKVMRAVLSTALGDSNPATEPEAE